jgi:hypothetical protein
MIGESCGCVCMDVCCCGMCASVREVQGDDFVDGVYKSCSSVVCVRRVLSEEQQHRVRFCGGS